MTVKAKIETTTVISALSHLRYDRQGTVVTPEKIAEYLKCDVDDVKDHLRILESRRIVRRRRRNKEMVIVPWGGQTRF